MVVHKLSRVSREVGEDSKELERPNALGILDNFCSYKMSPKLCQLLPGRGMATIPRGSIEVKASFLKHVFIYTKCA